MAFLEVEGFGGLSVRPHKTIYSVGTTGEPARKVIALLYKNAPIALLRKAEIAFGLIDSDD